MALMVNLAKPCVRYTNAPVKTMRTSRGSGNRNQAYRKYREELQVPTAAYYGKVNRIEPVVSKAVIWYSAEKAGMVLEHLDFQPWDVLPRYRFNRSPSSQPPCRRTRLPQERAWPEEASAKTEALQSRQSRFNSPPAANTKKTG